MERKVVINLLIPFISILISCFHSEIKAHEMISYFSRNYQEARDKFISAARAIGADTESFRNPHTGPQSKPLYIDVAALGSKDATDIFVLSSGTHGVEGFVGSGIQTTLLREGIQSDLKPNVAILMIHAINPYGFAYLRRSNEDNVDLNRNFIDHLKPYPKNYGYAELADLIAPKSISFWENTKLRLNLLWYRLRNGTAALKQAVSGGQYAYAKGLFFGGHFETWSTKTLRDIIRLYLSNARRVIFIDVHTGLGPHGYAEIIMNVKPDTPAYKRAVMYWGERVRTTVKGKSVSVHLQTTLKLDVPKMLPWAEVAAVSLEFGTYPAKEVFWALRNENWLHHYGGESYPEGQKIKSELLRVFYPNTDEWKLQVWKQGKEVVDQALRHFQ